MQGKMMWFGGNIYMEDLAVVHVKSSASCTGIETRLQAERIASEQQVDSPPEESVSAGLGSREDRTVWTADVSRPKEGPLKESVMERGLVTTETSTSSILQVRGPQERVLEIWGFLVEANSVVAAVHWR